MTAQTVCRQKALVSYVCIRRSSPFEALETVRAANTRVSHAPSANGGLILYNRVLTASVNQFPPYRITHLAMLLGPRQIGISESRFPRSKDAANTRSF
jgi:hypothetical protein